MKLSSPRGSGGHGVRCGHLTPDLGQRVPECLSPSETGSRWAGGLREDMGQVSAQRRRRVPRSVPLRPSLLSRIVSFKPQIPRCGIQTAQEDVLELVPGWMMAAFPSTR